MQTTRDIPLGPTGVLAVVGPTAVGKTDLAEEIAVRVGGEIVSADSMQVYRGMDIGTAKPSVESRRVAHHCLDLAEPGESFSAALYQAAARQAIDDCHAREVVPVLCGGTGLYVRAALDPWQFPAGEQVGNSARERYEQIAAESGAGALHELLGTVDPASAALIHPNNVRRVIRALEMRETGVSYADTHAGLRVRESMYATTWVGLCMDRAVLYERIDRRVDGMIADGLVGEVEELLRAGLRDALTAAQAIGYKELVGVVEGTAELEDAVAAIKQASRRYAKRQLSWFRADPRIAWFDVTGSSTAQAASQVMTALHLTERTAG